LASFRLSIWKTVCWHLIIAPMFSIKRFQFGFSLLYISIDQHQWCILFLVVLCFIISFV
jgi:hypothetical protein